MVVQVTNVDGERVSRADATLTVDLGVAQVSVVSQATALVTMLATDYSLDLGLQFRGSDEPRYRLDRVGVQLVPLLVPGRKGQKQRQDLEVTGSLLRTIRVADAVRQVTEACIFLVDRSGGVGSVGDAYTGDGFAAFPPEALFDGDDASLRMVALSYQLARIASQPPAKAVERLLDSSPRTASNWVAKARDAGLIPNPKIARG